MKEKRIDNPVFREHLKMLMKEQHITQMVLAEKLNTTRKTISLWCIGLGYPDKYNLDRLTRFFNVSKEWLYGESEYRNGKEKMISSIDNSFSVNPFPIRFVETIEDITNKKLLFENDNQFDNYVSKCIESNISIAEKMDIKIEEKTKIEKKKRKRKGEKTE